MDDRARYERLKAKLDALDRRLERVPMLDDEGVPAPAFVAWVSVMATAADVLVRLIESEHTTKEESDVRS